MTKLQGTGRFCKIHVNYRRCISCGWIRGMPSEVASRTGPTNVPFGGRHRHQERASVCLQSVKTGCDDSDRWISWLFVSPLEEHRGKTKTQNDTKILTKERWSPSSSPCERRMMLCSGSSELQCFRCWHNSGQWFRVCQRPKRIQQRLSALVSTLGLTGKRASRSARSLFNVLQNR
jgi:hypothetical protein